MRKILLFTVILASMSFASIAVEATTVGSASVGSPLSVVKAQFGPVFQPRRWRRWDNRNDRFRRERYEIRTSDTATSFTATRTESHTKMAAITSNAYITTASDRF